MLMCSRFLKLIFSLDGAASATNENRHKVDRFGSWSSLQKLDRCAPRPEPAVGDQPGCGSCNTPKNKKAEAPVCGTPAFSFLVVGHAGFEPTTPTPPE